MVVGKVCSKCKRWLLSDQFYEDKSKSSGIKSQCKKCVLKQRGMKKRGRVSEIEQLRSLVDAHSVEILALRGMIRLLLITRG